VDQAVLRSLHEDLDGLVDQIDGILQRTNNENRPSIATFRRPQVLILGGSFAGLEAAHKIRQYAKDTVDITVIDRKSYLLFVPNILFEILANRDPAINLHLPIVPALAKDDIRFVLAEVHDIDVERNQVRVGLTERAGSPNQTMRYDYLVVALGNRLAYDAITGFSAYGHAITDTFNGNRLRHFLHNQYLGGPILIGSARFHKGTALNDWIPTTAAACEGPAIETIFSVDQWLKKRGLSGASRITFFTPGQTFAEDAGPQAAAKLLEMANRRGYRYLPNVIDIGQITAEGIEFLNGQQVEAELKIVLPDWVPYSFLNGLPITDDRGFVITERRMRNPTYPNVLAVGDAAALTIPKLGYLAYLQAAVVGWQIAKDLGRSVPSPADLIFTPLIDCLGMMGSGQGFFLRSNAWYGGNIQKLYAGPVPFYLKASYKSIFFLTQGKVPDWSVKMADFLARQLSFKLLG
jgi:sulfide:quinone oxidoreductase